MKNIFIVVVTDEYFNSVNYVTCTGELGDVVKEIYRELLGDLLPESELNDIACVDKLNSDYPYDRGAFDIGFYDKDIISIENEEYLGSIKIIAPDMEIIQNILKEEIKC